MPKITIEVEIPAHSPEQLWEAIVSEATRKVLDIQRVRHTDEDGYEWTEDSIGLLGALRHRVEEKVSSTVKESVEAAVPALVDEVLSAEFQPMTKWGEKTGEPTTIRAMAGRHAHDWLTEKVSENGRNDYNARKAPRLHWAVKNIIDEMWQKDLRTVAQEAGKQIREELAGRISADVSATVRKIVGIK